MLFHSQRPVLFLGVFCVALLDFSLRSYAEVCNAGIAFGIEIPRIVLLSVNFLFLFFLFSLWMKERRRLFETGLLLILIGGAANYIDRLVYGCVRDYLTLPGFPLFPSFNLSDTMLFLGVGGLILAFFRDYEPAPN